MNLFENVLILSSFLVEVVVLFFCEKKLWGTVITPLNSLMIPYTIVLLITVSLPKSLGFVEFYYPSILIWSVGLVVFFIPSLLLALWSYKMNIDFDYHVKEPISTKPLVIFSILLLFFFAFRFFFAQRMAQVAIGSKEFASDFSNFGVFGHIMVSLLALEILWIFMYSKGKRIYLFILAGIIIITVLNQVKSWMLIPILAGLLMRILTNKTRLKVKIIIPIIIGGFAFFYLSNYLTLVIAGDSELSLDLTEWISVHFLHYLTSGLMGLSVDAQQGLWETSDPSMIFSPFINFIQLFIGNPLGSPVNPFFLDSGVDGTNVRTFFGTIFLYLPMYFSVIYVLLISFVFYQFRMLNLLTKNICIAMLDIWFCILLFMGWFDFYFQTLNSLEVPFWIVLLMFFNNFMNKIDFKLKLSTHK